MSRASVLLGVLALALVGSGGLFGDDPKKDPQGKVRGTLPPNWNKLGLTEEQKQKIYTVRADYRTKIDALQQQIKDLQRKEMTDMQKVLTDAQKARLRELATEKVPTDGTKPPETKKPDGR